ncbi:TetR/AcrR family transcriptional regulator [Sinimarinibacterium sp. CAU 1509]|uniref:TetR/AcrR family transcriptional regulator n=1 Tax=Sinimarinibacterium sp. CAU 1509 TaxID=2562283 RepID=UPI0010AC0904|nr:TetR/AcrR family transcriptional regulator [Sinimarinibacterium sp. CAU 1509]TJY59727.1 TetR/AcrR family transcriptional regulator [Sinimarinibacterium sp. CAU 1509]
MNTIETERNPIEKPRGGKARLFDRAEIVSAALSILDEEGHEALSLRAIARKLGTGPATIYNYFKSLMDVEDAIVSHLMSSVRAPEPTRNVPLREQLVDMAVSYHKVVLQHPNLESVSGPTAERSRVLLINSTLRTLVDAGVSIEVAALCVSLLRGFAYNQAIALRGSEKGLSVKARRAWVKTMAPGEIDMIVALRQSDMFKGSQQEAFRKGVETTIDRMMPELSKPEPGARKGQKQ